MSLYETAKKADDALTQIDEYLAKNGDNSELSLLLCEVGDRLEEIRDELANRELDARIKDGSIKVLKLTTPPTSTPKLPKKLPN